MNPNLQCKCSVLLFWLWAVELNDSVLPSGHPVWFLGGELLPLAWLQTDLDVSFESPQATEWCRGKASQCGVEARRVVPVPVPSQLPVVQITFKQHQVCPLQRGVQVRSISRHVAELMGLRPEGMVVVGPHPLLHVALPLYTTLGHPHVIGCHGLPDGPLEIVSCDVRDKPRETFAVEMDLPREAWGDQEIR